MRNTIKCTVAPEGLRLGSDILEVNIKILPRGLSEMKCKDNIPFYQTGFEMSWVKGKLCSNHNKLLIELHDCCISESPDEL